ncbi:MAG: hypothetical protein K2Z80_21215 [Xanthobacteraceae bacterium]|nr:hypothetical protein [Xanthobacteraceae bacterium]
MTGILQRLTNRIGPIRAAELFAYQSNLFVGAANGAVCYIIVVRMSPTIGRLLAALALLGLVLAPLSGPAMAVVGAAKAAGLHATADGQSAQSGAAMPDAMPCCPDETPMPDCSKHCQMAICAASVLLSVPAPSWISSPPAASHKLAGRQDRTLSGVSLAPLPKPPKA